MSLKVDADKKCDFLTTSNRDLEKVLNSTNSEVLELK